MYCYTARAIYVNITFNIHKVQLSSLFVDIAPINFYFELYTMQMVILPSIVNYYKIQYALDSDGVTLETSYVIYRQEEVNTLASAGGISRVARYL